MSKDTVRTIAGSSIPAVLDRQGLALRPDFRRLLLGMAGAALCLFLGMVPAYAEQDGTGSEIISVGASAGNKLDVGTGKFVMDGVTGNVGVGSSVPQLKLDVEGSVYVGNGNIGVGSSAPAQKIDVIGTIKATAFSGDGSALTGLSTAIGWTKTGTNVYVTTSTDNVGIGTISPSGQANVYSLTNGTDTRINYGTDSVIWLRTDGATTPGNFVYFYDNWSSSEMRIKKGSGNNVLVYAGSGDDLVLGSNDSAVITLKSGGNVGINSSVPQAKLDVEGNVYIGNGNVGIGTTAPNSPLHVIRSSTGTVLSLGRTGIWNVGEKNGIMFRDEGTYGEVSGINAVPNAANTWGLSFETRNAGSNQESVRILGNGNVGIGSTVPQAKLDVEGSVYFGNGNIGVASTAPGQKIDVTGTVRATAFLGDGSGLSGLGATAWGTSGANVYLTTSSNNVGIGTSTPAGKLVVYGGNMGIGSTAPAVKLDVVGAGTTSATTSMIIRASDATPRLTVFDNGNVGVGSTVPAAMLDIVSTDVNAISYFGSNVGIGSTNPGALLTVQSGADTVIFRLKDSDGTCDYNPEAAAALPSCSSDARLKEDIHDTGSVLAEFMRFRVRDYRTKASGHKMTGIIAQEVLPYAPQMVTMGDDGYYKVAAPDLWKIVRAIQELKAENDSVRADVESLKQLRVGNEAINKMESEFETENKDLQMEMEALRRIVCRDHPEEAVCQKKPLAVSPVVRRDLSWNQRK